MRCIVSWVGIMSHLSVAMMLVLKILSLFPVDHSQGCVWDRGGKRCYNWTCTEPDTAQITPNLANIAPVCVRGMDYLGDRSCLLSASKSKLRAGTYIYVPSTCCLVNFFTHWVTVCWVVRGCLEKVWGEDVWIYFAFMLHVRERM